MSLATSSPGCRQHSGHIVPSVLSLHSSLPCLLRLPLPSWSQYCPICPQPVLTQALVDSLPSKSPFQLASKAQLYVLDWQIKADLNISVWSEGFASSLLYYDNPKKKKKFTSKPHLFFYFRILRDQPTWCTRPTMSVEAREGKS